MRCRRGGRGRLLRLTAAARPLAGGRWGSTVAVAVGQLVAWGALYYSYAALAPSISSTLGVSRRATALSFSAALLVAGLLARSVGRALDRAGARAVLLAGAIVGPLSLLLLARAQGIVTLWVAFIMIGVAQSLALYEPAFRALVDWFARERERQLAMLVVTSLGGFASTVFVPLTVALDAAHGWRATVMALAIVLGLIALPVALLVPVRVSVAPPREGALEARPVAPPAVRRLAIAFGLQAFASAVVTVALIWHLVERGAAPLAAAFVAGLVGAAQVPGRLLVTPLQALVADRSRLPLNFVLQALALVALAFAPGGWTVTAAVLFGAAAGAMTLERAAVTVRWFGADRFGAVSGRIASVSLVGRAVAPIAVEGARSVVGYDAVLGGSALLLAAAAIVFSGAASAAPRAVSSNSGRSSAKPFGRGGSSIASIASSIVAMKRRRTAARTSAGMSRRSFSLAAGSTTVRRPAR